VKSLPLLFVLGFSTLGLLPAAALDVRITVQGIRSAKGKIAVLAFSNKDGFPDQVNKAVARTRVDAHAGRVTFTLRNVPAGKIAVAVMHDENANGQLNRNLFGIPLEGVGLSGKPVAKRPPSFHDAELELNKNADLQITLVYGFAAAKT
jgi:uncharacterized protein (DUF2141 family)